jgi:hypothetical protein
LPDKIVEFNGYAPNLRYLMHRKCIMDSVNIEKEDNMEEICLKEMGNFYWAGE